MHNPEGVDRLKNDRSRPLIDSPKGFSRFSSFFCPDNSGQKKYRENNGHRDDDLAIE